MTPTTPPVAEATEPVLAPPAKPAFTPTTTPLPPQDIHPDELAVILAETAARHAEAEAALAAAQDHFDAANREREYARSEEEKRRALEEEARVNDLRVAFPRYADAVAEARRVFYASFEEEEFDLERAVQLFVEWNRNIALAGRTRQEILRYDAQQSSEVYESWMRRIEGWRHLIYSVMSWRHGGAPSNAETDVEGLAAVNLRINQESKDAPRALKRDPADQSTPFIEDLGLRDPASASMDQIWGERYDRHISFDEAFSEGVAGAAIARARRLVPGRKNY